MTNQTQVSSGALWFGREPEALVSLIVGAVAALVALLPMNEGLAAAIAAVVAAVGGVVVAIAVKHDGVIAAIVGLAKAGMYALVIAGWNVPDTTQATVIAAITAVAALFVRQNVVARVGPTGAPVNTPAVRSA